MVLLALACAQVPQPTRIYPDGPYRHEITQLLLPERIGRFDRLYVTHYDPTAIDISGHYQGPRSCPSTATIYLYPAAATGTFPSEEQVLEHYAQLKRDVTAVTPDAMFISEKIDATTINGFDFRGLHAIYELPHLPAYDAPAESHLFLYVVGNWYLKFRFTHPRSLAAEASEYEREFISSITWPVPDS